MKLTDPDMDTLSDTGFPIFKPYGDPWYSCWGTMAMKGLITSVPLVTVCCVTECVPSIICANTMDIVAPLAVIITAHPMITKLMPCVYMLHPKIADFMFTERGADHVSNDPSIVLLTSRLEMINPISS
jgi:hypothetical protein